jgi:hypothetical protein
MENECVRPKSEAVFSLSGKSAKDFKFTPSLITHSLTHGAEPFLRNCQMCSYSRNSQHFMEP